MKTSTTLLSIVLLGAVGAGSFWLGARSSIPAHEGAGRRRVGAGGSQATQVAVLPQSDGSGGHLADAEEGPDGDGLRPGLRGRGRGRRAGVCQPGSHQHREGPEAGCARRGRAHARARQDRARLRSRRSRRAAHLRHRAEVRGLCRAAACQRDRPAGCQGAAAVRGLQPGAGVGAARIRDRDAGPAGDDGRRAGGAGRHGAVGGVQPDPAAQLGSLAGAGRGAGEDRSAATHDQLPVAGVGRGDREEGAAGHALHAGRHALPGDRPVVGLGHRRRVRAGHRPGQDGCQGQRRDQPPTPTGCSTGASPMSIRP